MSNLKKIANAVGGKVVEAKLPSKRLVNQFPINKKDLAKLKELGSKFHLPVVQSSLHVAIGDTTDNAYILAIYDGDDKFYLSIIISTINFEVMLSDNIKTRHKQLDKTVKAFVLARSAINTLLELENAS